VRRMGLLVLVLVVPFLMSNTVHATANSPLTLNTVSHGVKLTLTVPSSEYLAGALVRVQIAIENVSAHPVQLAGTCPPWGTPWVAVLDGIGNVVYPPAVTAVGVKGRTSCSNLYLVKRLSPGAAIKATRLIVLRDTHLQVRATLATHVENGSQVTGFRDLHGKIMNVRLISTSVEAATGVSASTFRVTVPMSAGDTGPLYYQYVLRCDNSGSTSYSGTWRWRHASGSSIELTRLASCSTIPEWHVAAGYLGHPVSLIDYPASTGSP
jgi:hypothetical protein